MQLCSLQEKNWKALLLTIFHPIEFVLLLIDGNLRNQQITHPYLPHSKFTIQTLKIHIYKNNFTINMWTADLSLTRENAK